MELSSRTCTHFHLFQFILVLVAIDHQIVFSLEGAMLIPGLAFRSGKSDFAANLRPSASGIMMQMRLVRKSDMTCDMRGRECVMWCYESDPANPPEKEFLCLYLKS